MIVDAYGKCEHERIHAELGPDKKTIIWMCDDCIEPLKLVTETAIAENSGVRVRRIGFVSFGVDPLKGKA